MWYLLFELLNFFVTIPVPVHYQTAASDKVWSTNRSINEFETILKKGLCNVLTHSETEKECMILFYICCYIVGFCSYKYRRTKLRRVQFCRSTQNIRSFCTKKFRLFDPELFLVVLVLEIFLHILMKTRHVSPKS